MRTFLTFLVGFGALSVSAPAFAEDGDLHGKVMDLLLAYETPATAEDFQALGPGVEAELMTVAKDSDLAISKRTRAVQALAYVPSPEGRAYIEGVLADPAQESLMRRQAAIALATGWPTDNHLPLTAALNDEDTQLRIAAAKALSMSKDPQAPAALEARLAIEENDAVKPHLSAAPE